MFFALAVSAAGIGPWSIVLESAGSELYIMNLEGNTVPIISA